MDNKKTSKIIMKSPAANWNEALPVGNGRLGAMVFGGVCTEYLQLNEDSVWYGGKRDRINPSAKEKLPEIRELINKGEIVKAQDLASLALSGIPDCQRHYEALGNLYIHFKGNDEYSEYTRALDMDKGIVTVSYTKDEAKFSRTILSSNEDKVLALYMTCDKPGKISFNTQLVRGNTTWDLSPYETQSYRHPGYADYMDDNIAVGDNMTLMTATCGGKGAISLVAGIKIINDGGTVEQIGNSIVVENADSILLVLSADTTFYSKEPKDTVVELLNKVTGIENDKVCSSATDIWEGILKRHIINYSELYKQVSIELDDSQWEVERFFNFGRYLLISSSRPGSLPANLQGIWNDNYNPAWGSKFTININTEMNYWPAESCGLGICQEPLFDLIGRMRPNGREVAKKMYGCRGFVAHHNTDIWADCAPQDTCLSATYWVMGAAWLCLHIWEHYLYTNDKDFLAKKYETMLEAALFVTDYLVEDGDYLVTNPTVSPENEYILPNGQTGVLCKSASMDNQIMRELFEACINASKILADSNTEAICSDGEKSLYELYGMTTEEIIARIIDTKAKIAPIALNANGGIREWNEDYEEVDPGHRHISHLFALYPGNQIRPEDNELMEAAQKTLTKRLANGGGHTGWSRAWIINLYARLGKGDEALKHVNLLLEKSTLPNLLDNHPPFQIDGNFGAAAGILEMLVDTRTDGFRLLPALPTQWKNGKVTGVRIKGNKKLSFEWKDGKVIWSKLEENA